jgi:hypothetical protein
MKNHFYKNAHLITTPTEKGMKDIDVFHPSYRVKRLNKVPLTRFNPRYLSTETKGKLEKEDGTDLFIDIL